MTKRAVFLTVLLAGVAGSLGLAEIPKVPSLHNGWTLSAGMMFWATLSASATVAFNSGAWRERFNRSAPIRSGKLPSWAWPLLIICMAVANYLTAIAIVAGHALFRGSPNSTEPVTRP